MKEEGGGGRRGDVCTMSNLKMSLGKSSCRNKIVDKSNLTRVSIDASAAFSFNGDASMM
jgi:hypothetical protein